MTIKDMERLTGITRQNIRFYEKKGLLAPKRNKDNDYRTYSEEDVETLLMVKMLRKLGMSIELIKPVIEKEISVFDAIIEHKVKLVEEDDKLQSAIRMCEALCKIEAKQLDINKCLNRMEEIERRGGKFVDILNDYKAFVSEERGKRFSFVPNNMCMNPTEFAISLSEYASEQHLDMIITKECMYPEFEINGIKYVANRVWGRFGAVVRCEVMDNADVESAHLTAKTRKKMKFIRRIVSLLAVLAVIVILAGPSLGIERIMALSFLFIIIGTFSYAYRNLR